MYYSVTSTIFFNKCFLICKSVEQEDFSILLHNLRHIESIKYIIYNIELYMYIQIYLQYAKILYKNIFIHLG